MDKAVYSDLIQSAILERRLGLLCVHGSGQIRLAIEIKTVRLIRCSAWEPMPASYQEAGEPRATPGLLGMIIFWRHIPFVVSATEKAPSATG